MHVDGIGGNDHRMVRMPVLLSLITFVVLLAALIDIITKTDGQVKHLPKMVWIIIVILLPLIGSILWFAIGREYAAPVDRGGFADARRRARSSSGPMNQPAAAGWSTEQELADLEREIEEAHLRRLEQEWEQRGDVDT